MTIFDNHFPLGLGTSRFPISGPNDVEGIKKSEDLVVKAIEMGIDYIDTSYPYSAGMANTVLKGAFARTMKDIAVTVKVMHDMDKTAEDTIKRVKMQLEAMGIRKAKYFVCWTIWNYDIFKEIMKKGGVYEGALKLKEEGLIEHICFSTHAPAEDNIKILEANVFEGMTISYSMLNAAHNEKVLDKALEMGVGVTVMNPLGGGVIAQNDEFFSFSKNKSDKSSIHAALKFAKSHPAIKIVLNGLSNIEQLEDSILAFKDDDCETKKERYDRVIKNVADIKGFCTGCKYCEPCPAGIPISETMQARNALLFAPVIAYNRTEENMLYDIQIFRRLLHDNEWLPKTEINPCINCKKCEKSCTQGLKIIQSIEDNYQRGEKAGFYLEHRKKRISELLFNKNYKKVGLYPNGGFANLIMKYYEDFFGKPDFDWTQFNSDPKMWGQYLGGVQIMPPNEIPIIKPDIILICTFKFDKEIYMDLKKYEEMGIKIEKLHIDSDVPWIF